MVNSREVVVLVGVLAVVPMFLSVGGGLSMWYRAGVVGLDTYQCDAYIYISCRYTKAYTATS